MHQPLSKKLFFQTLSISIEFEAPQKGANARSTGRSFLLHFRVAKTGNVANPKREVLLRRLGIEAVAKGGEVTG
jgi:hypothetical protein